MQHQNASLSLHALFYAWFYVRCAIVSRHSVKPIVSILYCYIGSLAIAAIYDIDIL